MRALAHVPLLHLDEPRAVLVIGFGVGNTAHAASLHDPVERIEIADLSRNILEHAHHFEAWNRGVLADPRVRVFVHDGRQHLRMTGAEYDLVTLEPPPLTAAGVSALYSREFYRLARSRLGPGGLVTQWLPAYQVDRDNCLAIVRAFVDVFPDAVLLSGYKRHLILMGRKDEALTIDPVSLARRLRARPAVSADLEAHDMGSLAEFLGSFAGDGATLRAAAALSPPVTDDWPVMEYGASLFSSTSIPRELFDVGTIDVWCPDCFPAGAPGPGLERLRPTLRLLGHWYASENFLVSGGPDRSRPAYRADLPDPHGELREAYLRSRYLRQIAQADPSD